MLLFWIDDVVVAGVAVQGLVKGAEYRVIGASVINGVASYDLESVEDDSLVELVGDAYWVLDKVG